MTTDFYMGEWIIRPKRDCIERDGKVVHVKPKAMAVLVRLAAAVGDVVTRNDLFDTVWPGSVVTDDVLTQCIVELRKAFGDSARKQLVIETIPKVGFRLVQPVALIDDASVLTSGEAVLTGESNNWNPTGRIVVIITSTILMALVLFWYLTGMRDILHSGISNEASSVAVLPFVDMSANKDQEYFADGLSEEMISRLAQIKGLLVTGRTSSFHYKDKNDDLRDIAAALGVGHLLEGSVRKDENRLRITAQLIEGKNGFHIWAKQYDRPLEEIFAVQGEIAESVATALSIELQVGEAGVISGGTTSFEAYEEVLLARSLNRQYTSESMLQAIDHVKRAIEIDPDYALAWYHLAGLYVNAGTALRSERSPDWALLSEQALARAKNLQPDLPGVLTMTAHIQMKAWQWSELETTLNGGKGLNISTDSELLFAYCGFLGRVGRLEEGIPLLERLSRLEPMSPGTAMSLGHMYAALGRIDEGLAEVERAYQIGSFRLKSAYIGMSIALATDHRDLLLKWLARAEQYGEPESRRLIRTMTELLDDHEAALDFLRGGHHLTGQHDLLIAMWSAWHGDSGLALETMQRSTAPSAFWAYEMREVRRTPGFKDLVRKVGLDSYFREFGWNDFCQPLGSDDFVCQ